MHNYFTACYENININESILSRRSTLYSLEPLGIGTGQIESFTSYICRLVNKHSISVKDLFIKIVPLQQDFTFPYGPEKINAFFKWSGAINSNNKCVNNYIRLFNQLTGRNDLQYLTLQKWQYVIPKNGLISNIKGYCPYCYEYQKINNHEIYDQLLWLFNSNKVCPIHQTNLLYNCHYEDCRKKMDYLSSYAMPGYCSKCRRWLGIEFKSTYKFKYIGVSDEQLWISEQLQKLLKKTDQSNIPQRDIIKSSLLNIAQVYANSSIAELSRFLNMRRQPVYDWCAGKTLPSIDTLLYISGRIKTSLDRLLMHGKIDIESEEKFVNIAYKSQKRSLAKIIDDTEIYNKLSQILNMELPISLNEITKKFNLTRNRLVNKFPTLCKNIVEKRQQYKKRQSELKLIRLCTQIKETIISVYSTGIYPSQLAITRHVKNHFSFKNPKIYDTWITTLNELGLRK